jgi:hypothetical protein
MIALIFLFSIISSLLTLIGVITYFLNARRRYRQVFAESFISFIDRLHVPYTTSEDYIKYSKYIDDIILHKFSTYSIEQYFAATHHIHKNNSKHYADIFTNLQHHKLKTFLLSLISGSTV